MKKSKSRLLVSIFIVFSAGLCGLDSAKAALTTYSINGIFSDIVTTDNRDPISTTYPFPQLLGGSFQGEFSFDLNDPKESDYTLGLRSVSIDVIAKTGELVRKISIMPVDNNFFNSDGDYVNFYFGYSAGILSDVIDLRVSFRGNLSDPNFSFSDGFLETDITAYPDRNYSWDLLVDSATLTHISGPILDVPTYPYSVPIPPGILLFGSGVIGFCLLRKSKDVCVPV
ncbi:MAG: hypothetical protein PHC94_07165 [Methylobacter sp.]|nr:hypothetical protein [Methylobacter sp.]